MELEHPEELGSEDINEMEERRLNRLDEAGINEMDVLSQARENINIFQNAFNENITRGKDDVNFATRDQWSAIERSEFTRLQKVCFTANKMLDTINKICGEQRKNRPDPMVRSLTGKATQEQINLRADLVRTISYQSQNNLVYQQAFKSGLEMGWGAFQVDIDYENPRSFRKIHRFKIINDATKCSWDPSAKMPHKGDGDYCAHQYVFGREQFSATYPYILNPVSYADPRMFMDFQWETKDTIVMCDYFIKEWFPLKIYELSDGREVSESEWEELEKTDHKLKRELSESKTALKEEILALIPEIVDERQSQDYVIMRYYLIKDKIIDFQRWPSKFLPIIFVDGNSEFIDGRQHTKSFIHEARDTQKFANYILSERATEIKNRRREQWMGTPDNIVGMEQQWRNPEVQVGILTAKPDPKTGQLPTKLPPWQLSQELIVEYQSASQDMREIMGFNEQQEIQGRDISGKARRERKLEGSMASYVQFDNLNQAIEQSWRVVLDTLPYVVGENERHMVISKKDGKSESIVLNKRMPDGSIENQIEGGDYDVEISTGPSFAVQKEMALEFFQQTLAANPQVFPLIADLWAKNMDVQYMEQISDRFKTMVPPEILAKEEGKPVPPKQPSPQEQAMKMEMEFKQAELKEKEEDLRLRSEAHALEKEKHELEKLEMILKAKKMESEMRINEQKQAGQSTKAEMDYSAKIAKVIADLHKQ